MVDIPPGVKGAPGCVEMESMSITILPSDRPVPASGRRRWVIAAVVALALVVGGGFVVMRLHGGAATAAGTGALPRAPRSPAGSAALAPLDPASSLAAARSAALHAGSVHVTSDSTEAGSPPQHYDQDSAVDNGTQTVTVGSAAPVRVQVVGKVTYVRGGQSGLVATLGFSAPTAATLANAWLKAVPGVEGYEGVTEGVTLPSVLDELNLTAPFTVLPRSMHNGHTAVGVQGTFGHDEPSTIGTVWLPVDGAPLPLEFTATGSTKTLTGTFSGWGSTPATTAPTGPVFALPTGTGRTS